jgi:hypothetical protein
MSPTVARGFQPTCSVLRRLGITGVCDYEEGGAHTKGIRGLYGGAMSVLRRLGITGVCDYEEGGAHINKEKIQNIFLSVWRWSLKDCKEGQ